MKHALAATYRLQFRNGMDFDAAAQLAPYLKRLGISHLYASPVFRATEGSSHGYDVTDHQHFDPALSGDAGFERLSAALEDAGLGLILDIVPNHMAASPQNPWWHDVLEWGEASPFARYFDIDWCAPKLVLPLLGGPFGQVVEAGEIGLRYAAAEGRFAMTYFDTAVPLAPTSYPLILERLGVAEPAAFTSATPDTIGPLRDRMHTDLPQEPDLAPLAADGDFLNRLHEAQVWQLAYWRLGRDGLTYRRFFEISELVGVRVEDDAVFDAVHQLPLSLVRDGRVDGLRIDHIDGVAYPGAYLRRLRSKVGEVATIHVEKILEGTEPLRNDWPVDGTTGYEFITDLAGLFTEPSGEDVLDATYTAFLAGRWPNVDPMLVKTVILTGNLAGELLGLQHMVLDIAASDPAARDFGTDTLRRAIIALVAAFPVYRTYVGPEGASDEDRAVIADAVASAKQSPLLEDPLPIDLVAGYLTGDVAPDLQDLAHTFAKRFQQTTGAVMAKAIEDTLYYRDARLIGLNEVGGDPQRFGAPLSAFHDAMIRRAECSPLALSATATHDTKRGEDARARLYVISERATEWAGIVSRLAADAEGLRQELEDGPAPSRNLEWKIYQSIYAAWPADLAPDDAHGMAAFRERLDAYLEKALREAKSRTTWTSPNTEYEDAVRHFAASLLAPETGMAARMAELFAPFWRAGALNALAQVLIKATAPGVPDIYQGTERWDFSFVDPDNRRPVDFDMRQAAQASEASAQALLADWTSGEVKQYVLSKALTARAARPDLFSRGDYVPLPVSGPRAENVLAFCRHQGDDLAVVAAPVRASAGITGDLPLVDGNYWGDTTLMIDSNLAPASRVLRDAFTGVEHSSIERLPVAGLLNRFPVALLL